MVSEAIIAVEGLGKSYRLGARRSTERYTALRDVLSETAKGLFRRNRNLTSERRSLASVEGNASDFWALKDVSFEVKRGEVLGIVGRNGAGKSTLLKILSRITDPTEGRVRIRGRVASLLEVGTGFHPELTGRENIFLNGAILGMHRHEIKAKFDEIVAFAEVEKFLDTPVKRYSSGMYVRLAFAVAAHLEPEILIVDEVLAVGDAEFQKKCLGKMQSVADGGRTVLFVSHQMSAIQALCSGGVLLRKGTLEHIGSAREAVEAYLGQDAASDRFVRTFADATEQPRIAEVVLHWKDNCVDDAPIGLLHVTIFSSQRRRVALDLRLKDALNAAVGFGSLGTLCETEMLELHPGKHEFIVNFSTEALANGSYSIDLDLTAPFIEVFDRVEGCIRFDLEPPPVGPGMRRVNQRWGFGSSRLNLHLAEPVVSP